MNQAQLKDTIAQTVFTQCFALQPDESVLIVMDAGKQRESDLFAELARRFTNKVTVLELTGMTENAQEPPEEVAEAMKQFDVALLVTTLSLSHTSARETATAAGTRIASLPGITLDMIERTLSSDYSEIAQRSDAVEKILSAGKRVEITSPAGTKLTLSIVGRTAIADAGQLAEPGSFSNLPAGEAFLAPVEGTTQGVLVIDGSIADIQFDSPVRVTIQDGKAISVEGEQAAKDLLTAMQEVGEGAFIVAELGIGTNPNAIVDSDILESEKVLGTCHIAFGNNAHFGGTNNVPFHTDGLVLKPTVLVDGKPLLEDGVLTIS
jgi:leucyl aminopeptidase (aminopeptidase T)